MVFRAHLDESVTRDVLDLQALLDHQEPVESEVLKVTLEILVHQAHLDDLDL